MPRGSKIDTKVARTSRFDFARSIFLIFYVDVENSSVLMFQISQVSWGLFLSSDHMDSCSR